MNQSNHTFKNRWASVCPICRRVVRHKFCPEHDPRPNGRREGHAARQAAYRERAGLTPLVDEAERAEVEP